MPVLYPARSDEKQRVNRMERASSEQCIEKSRGQNGNLVRNPGGEPSEWLIPQFNGEQFTWGHEEQIICDTCGAVIAPGDLKFYARSAIGPLMKLCAGCCAQEEPIPCDRCGTLIPPGVMPHLHVAGLPVPFLCRLCKRCWRAVNAMDVAIYDELLEQDSLWIS